MLARMDYAYDAIVVGARCAGASTAMLLARAGHRILLVDRASFPSEIARGHFIHRDWATPPVTLGPARHDRRQRLLGCHDHVLQLWRLQPCRRQAPRYRGASWTRE